MNNVCIIGNMVSDPELKYTKGATPLASCRFRVAVNDGYGEKRETYFLTVQAWRKQAENVEKYCHKGSKVAVMGRIRTYSYDKQDGTKVNAFEIVANNVEFLDSKNSGGEQRAEAQMEVPQGFAQVEDETIPF